MPLRPSTRPSPGGHSGRRPDGISTAAHLRAPWVLFEREDRLGGHARTDERDGYRFDKTGHWLHLRDPAVKQLVDELLPGADGADRAQGPNFLARRADALPLPGELARPAARGDQGVPAGRDRGQGSGTARRRPRSGELRGVLPAPLRRRDLQALHDPLQREDLGRAPARDHRRLVLALRAAAQPRAGGRGRGGGRTARDGLQPELPLPEVGRHRDLHARARRRGWPRRRARDGFTRGPARRGRLAAARGAVGGERLRTGRWWRRFRCPSC